MSQRPRKKPSDEFKKKAPKAKKKPAPKKKKEPEYKGGGSFCGFPNRNRRGGGTPPWIRKEQW